MSARTSPLLEGDEPDPPGRAGIGRVTLRVMALAMLASVGMYAAAGATLGLFFGGILLAALLVPPLGLIRSNTPDRLLVAAGVCDGIAVVWLVTLFGSSVTLV